MNIKKYLLLLIILIILINITCINATENNTDIIEQNNHFINENINITENDEITNHQETLTKSENEDSLQLNENETILTMSPPDSNYWWLNPEGYHTQFSLKINNTTVPDTTKNITFNIHLEWDLYMDSSYYNDAKILVYENNTVIHSFQMTDLSGEYVHNAHDIKDVSFQYLIKDKTELKATLKTKNFELEPYIFSFEKIKDITINNLKNNSIIINNNNYSNESWTNQIRYLKKAIEEASENSIIHLNNVEFLNDENLTINIDKNLTIIGNNAIINGLDYGTIFTINPQTTVNLINITFTNTMTSHMIKNNGNLKISNTSFKNNIGRLISNTGDLTLENCNIENITSKYYALSFNEIDTLENGAIHNSKMLTLINTTFNNIDLHPFTINERKINWDGIIVNDAKTLIVDSYFTNTDYRLIYNNGLIEIKNTLIDNSATTITSYTYKNIQQLTDNVSYFTYSREKESIEGGSVYNNNECIISNITYQNMQIYNNNNQLTIENITSDSRLIINNFGNIIIKNTTTLTTITNNGNLTIKNTTLKASITNNANFTIKNTTLTPASITNNGKMIVNETVLTGNSGITNNGIMTVSHCQIINNNAGNSLILNNGDGNFIIEKTMIKKNTITAGQGSGAAYYYGLIRNSGVMTVTGCVFDNNTARDWREEFGNAEGAICIYNSGKITVMYNYLLNVNYYKSGLPSDVPYHVHTPLCFLDNYYKATCNMNYNFFCLSPGSVVYNAAVNYYFIPSFSDYVPVKLNQDVNISLTLGLTNGKDKMDFDDWDRLLIPGLNATITTLDGNGEYFNKTILLKDFYTFNFNYTSIKGEYPIYATIMNYRNDAIVDVGKEFASMNVSYSNIHYLENMTFHVKVNGNITTPSGNITFTFNKQKYTVNLTGGECDFTIPAVLDPGNYTVKVEYNGDDEYFKILRKYYDFTVFKCPSSVNVTAPGVYYGETGTITVTLTPSTARLYATVYVNGKSISDDLALQDTITLSTIRGVGTYNITVIVDGDEYFTGCSASTLFTVSKWPTNLTVKANDIKAGENATVNITISPGDIKSKAYLEINGKNETIYLEDATTSITLTDLSEGTYTVTVYYPGSKYQYLPSSDSAVFSVSRKTTFLSVDIISNPDLTGYILVNTGHADATGEVGLFINNDPLRVLNLTDGCCNFTVNFKRGNNLIYIQYNGDDYYSVAIWNTTRFIEGAAIIIQENTSFAEQETGYYRINLTDKYNNPFEYSDISVAFKNETFNLTTDEYGIAYLPIKAKAGTYSITTNYKNTSKTSTIIITPTKINITVKDILAGEIETITVTLPENASGNITLSVDNVPYERVLVNGTCTFNIPDLSLGGHNLTLSYSGDDNYTSQTVNKTFHIKNSLSWTQISFTNTTYGDAITVTADVTPGVTGNVTFTIYDQTLTVNITDNQARATFTGIPAGNRTVTAHYNGDSIYQGSDASGIINIRKAKSQIKLNTTDLAIGENILITATVSSDATGNITFHIVGLYSPRNITLKDGEAEWYIQPLKPGSYMLNLTYYGDANYEDVKLQEILVVNRTKTYLGVNISDVKSDEDLMVYASLYDENNQKVTGDLILTIDDSYRIIITNGTGSRNLGQFSAGTYSYSAVYLGGDYLAMSAVNGTFTVTQSSGKADNYRLTGNSDIVQYYGATKYYKIRLLNNGIPVKGAVITISIGKNTIKLQTDSNGYVTLKLKLNAGKYTITGTYKNLKVTNKITVKKTLITKDKKIKKGKTLTYTAKLLNKNGKALKNKKITFKIKGKKYKAKTNKKGIAKIKVKKLKVGKYKIITTYGKQKNTNRITVKK